VKTVKAMLGGRQVVARPTGRDHKGRPYTGAGYREATIRVKGETERGRLYYYSGAWRFEPYVEASE
jgi:hypothetical protein